MANLKSAKKRVNVNNSKRVQNMRYKSDMRTQIKRLESLISENDKPNAQTALQLVNKKIDKAVQKGAVHRNNGDHHKSRLARRVSAIEA